MHSCIDFSTNMHAKMNSDSEESVRGGAAECLNTFIQNWFGHQLCDPEWCKTPKSQVPVNLLSKLNCKNNKTPHKTLQNKKTVEKKKYRWMDFAEATFFHFTS